ncbi:hypothetical protein Fmac_015990 [Flemingia macrophylla]|uniref:Glutaminyl-peptide cyclotransferase n=1 Tax=Flemingia macrophylla TaxID=520843 RepID=A0ABD1MG79_9FABA
MALPPACDDPFGCHLGCPSATVFSSLLLRFSHVTCEGSTCNELPLLHQSFFNLCRTSFREVHTELSWRVRLGGSREKIPPRGQGHFGLSSLADVAFPDFPLLSPVLSEDTFSTVRKVALRTGKIKLIDMVSLTRIRYILNRLLCITNSFRQRSQVEKIQKMGDSLFGEGTFNHDMEDGWGLATDGKVLFGSDGSSTMYQIDSQTFQVYIPFFAVAISKQVVYYKGHQIYNLNELEYINGEVWANVFPTDCIVRISPSDGSVLGWILLQNLRKELMEAGMISVADAVLNGIAWDGEQKRIFVTGKLWPKLYEIKVSPIKKPIEEAAIEQLCLHGPLTQPKAKKVKPSRKLRA